MRYATIILIALTLFSCRSKKKTVERSNIQSEVVISKDTKEILNNDITTVKDTFAVKNKTYDSTKETFKAKPIDKSKPIVITDNKSGKSYTAINAEIEVVKQIISKKEIDTTNSTSTIIDKSQVKREVSDQSNEIKSELKRNTNSEVKGVNFLVAAGIALSIIIVVILVYMRYSNRLKW